MLSASVASISRARTRRDARAFRPPAHGDPSRVVYRCRSPARNGGSSRLPRPRSGSQPCPPQISLQNYAPRPQTRAAPAAGRARRSTPAPQLALPNPRAIAGSFFPAPVSACRRLPKTTVQAGSARAGGTKFPAARRSATAVQRDREHDDRALPAEPRRERRRHRQRHASARCVCVDPIDAKLSSQVAPRATLKILPSA